MCGLWIVDTLSTCLLVCFLSNFLSLYYSLTDSSIRCAAMLFGMGKDVSVGLNSIQEFLWIAITSKFISHIFFLFGNCCNIKKRQKKNIEKEITIMLSNIYCLLSTVYRPNSKLQTHTLFKPNEHAHMHTCIMYQFTFYNILHKKHDDTSSST